MANSLNGGTPGAPLTPGNTGGASGVAFDSVDVEPGAKLVFDTTHTRGPGLAARHDLRADADAAYGWSSSFGNRTLWFGRTYLWIDRVRGDIQLVRAEAAGSLGLAIEITKHGKVRIRDRNEAIVALSSTAIPTRGWVRLEWKVDHASGVAQVLIFTTPESATPTETLTTASGRAIGFATDQVRFGFPGAHLSIATFWTDDTAAGWSGYLGRT